LHLSYFIYASSYNYLFSLRSWIRLIAAKPFRPGAFPEGARDTDTPDTASFFPHGRESINVYDL
jgi:hypothetical protein